MDSRLEALVTFGYSIKKMFHPGHVLHDGGAFFGHIQLPFHALFLRVAVRLFVMVFS